ncbi:MAG: SlyX family protein [Pseudomonadota bacterium]|nr:SlyX family protein [Pseudomonadota bacterium]
MTAEGTDARIEALESRIAFLEHNVDSLTGELTELTREFLMAKEALQLLYRKLENVQSGDHGIARPEDEPPPPHY